MVGLTDDRFYFIASDISISEQESNDLFLYIGMRMFSTLPNGNREGVTEAFIDSIIENKDMYNCLPLYVDIDNLKMRRYNSLGHMYNKMTGKFLTTQIGGICEFKKVNDEYGISLYGQARVPKREEEACRAILDQYSLGILNFSFEIRYSLEDTVVIDGIRFVDASPKNILTGMAIVSVPACKEATALNLVAEEVSAEVLGIPGDIFIPKVEVENDCSEVDFVKVDVEKIPPDIDRVYDNDVAVVDVEPQDERTDNMNLEEAMNAIAEKDAEIGRLNEEITRLKEAALAEDKGVEVEEKETEEGAEKKEEMEEMKASIEEKDRELEALRAELAGFEEMKSEYERMKAEAEAAELKAKQDRAKAFAEMQGLDVEQENVATAIAELNYERLASLSMEAKETVENKTEVTYSMVSEMEITTEYGDLLDRA